MMAQRPIIALALFSLLVGASSLASAQTGMGDRAGMHHTGPQIVIPEGVIYTKADVEFMQGMIAHHAQAIVMSKMAEDHGANPQVLKLSMKIDQSQMPEITIMQNWLRRHDQVAPDTSSWHERQMVGMLTPAQLNELNAARGVGFDRAYLSMMIMHHAGALKMVDDLFASPLAGQEVDVSVFANDVMTSQTGEIGIMQLLLTQLPPK
jgi:uncharacterized protein (DUF305 family)